MALINLWAEGFILGEDSAKDAIRQARELKKAPESGVNWKDYHPTKNPLGWRAGDRKSALLINPPNAFRRLLERQGVAIKGLDKTGYDRIGTALSRSIRGGLSATSAARQINDAIGDPARALTIAITEVNRAVSLGAIKTYKEAHLEKTEWLASDPCPECAQNAGQVIDIGGTFNSGAQQPPAHPHCRCALLPVIPEYETNNAGVVDVSGSHPGIAVGGGSPHEIYDHRRGSWSAPQKDQKAVEALFARKRALLEMEQGATYTDVQWASYLDGGGSGGSRGELWETMFAKQVQGQTVYSRGTSLVFVDDATNLKMPVEKYLAHIDILQAADPIDGLDVWIGDTKLKAWRKDRKTVFAAASRGGKKARSAEMAINPALTFDEPYRYDFGWKMALDNRQTPQYIYTMTHEWGHLREDWEGDPRLLSNLMDGLKANDKKIRALVKLHPELMSRYGKSDMAEAYAEAYAKWRLQVSTGGASDPLINAFAERFGWK